MAKRRGTPEALIAQLEKTISTLNKTVEQLNERIAQLGTQLEASAAREAALMARIDALQKARFGKRTEKMPTPREALRRKDRKSGGGAGSRSRGDFRIPRQRTLFPLRIGSRSHGNSGQESVHERRTGRSLYTGRWEDDHKRVR